MATQSKPQKFPYSYKTVSAPINSQFVFEQPYLQIINPQNLYEVELLQTHIRILFDASLPASYQKLLNVMVTGVDNNGATVRAAKGVTLNQSAVANIIDVSLDLSPFISKTSHNLVSFLIPVAYNDYPSATNILQLWKSDMAYTVKGIA